MTILVPLALVIDRPTAEQVNKSIAELGGAWVEMFDTWRRSEYRYLVLMAHTPERLRRRAPLTLMVDTDEALRSAIQTCCLQLDGKQCRWLLCLEPKSVADDIAKAEILHDSVVEGSA